jgi:hypothetical protein
MLNLINRISIKVRNSGENSATLGKPGIRNRSSPVIGPSRVRREESMRRRPSVQRCAVAALLMVAASASTRGPPGPLPVAVGVRRLTVAGGGPLQMHRCMRRSGRSPASTSIRCRRMRCANDSCLSSKRPSRYPMMRAGRFLHAYMAQCHTVG